MGLSGKILRVYGRKFHEELGEFQQALAEETPERQQAELGDLLFAVIQLARWHNLDPSSCFTGYKSAICSTIRKNGGSC